MSGSADSRMVAVESTDERVRQSRRERFWAWASLLVLVVAWDVSNRLDERASLPRMRIAHAAEEERAGQRIESTEL